MSGLDFCQNQITGNGLVIAESKQDYTDRQTGLCCLIFIHLYIVTTVITRGYREYVYSAVVYQKYLTRLRELIIFSPWRENYHFSQPS